MRQTIEGLKRLAERLKLLTALAALFLSGALISVGAAVAYYDRVISQIHGSYGGRIAAHNADMRRVMKELDHERDVTRRQLEEQAHDIDKISDDLARVVHMMQETSRTAAQAANTARSAATTAQGAAANAAKSAIRIRELPAKPAPTPAKPDPWPERIEP